MACLERTLVFTLREIKSHWNILSRVKVFEQEYSGCCVENRQSRGPGQKQAGQLRGFGNNPSERCLDQDSISVGVSNDQILKMC